MQYIGNKSFLKIKINRAIIGDIKMQIFPDSTYQIVRINAHAGALREDTIGDLHRNINREKLSRHHNGICKNS